MTDTLRTSLELLYHVSRELTSALELRVVLQRVLFLSLRNVGGERASIVVLDDQGQAVESAIVYGAQIHSHTTQQLRETVDRGLAGWVIRNRQAAVVPDTSRDERWLRRPDDAHDRSGAKSAVCVPLLARERLVGVLTLVHPEVGFFTNEHLALIQAIADQAGIAVLNARLYDESQRQARVMTALAESAVAMNASLQLGQVLQRILDQTAQALRVETVLFGRIDEVHQEIEFQAASSPQAKTVIGLRQPLEQGIPGRVAQTGQGVILSNAWDTATAKVPGLEVRALACAPVHAQGKTIGILEAVNPINGAFDPDALLVLSGIGSLAGVAIHNAQLYGLVEAEHQRYHELFEDSIDPILITNCDGKVQEANRQAAVNSGYAQNDLRGMQIDELTQIQWDKTGPGFKHVFQGATISYEAALCSAEGHEIPVQVNVRKVKIESEDCLQWILRDLTERKALDVMREDLIAMIYHDLRSPLANVVSSLDVMETLIPKTDNTSLSMVLKIAMRSTDRILRLVNSLLDIHRLEAGQPIVSPTDVDPYSLAGDAIETVKGPAEAKTDTLEINLPEHLPNLWVDADMMRRVLINLLENAIKYSPAGSKIQLGMQTEAMQIQLWVQDNGPGIPSGQQQAIFEKFTRLRGETPGKGLGIGLAFCRLAVEAHGGKIWVENLPQAGSRFTIELPLRSTPVQPAISQEFS